MKNKKINQTKYIASRIFLPIRTDSVLMGITVDKDFYFPRIPAQNLFLLMK